MVFEKIYELIKPCKKEYTEFFYSKEIESNKEKNLDINFGELEEICEDFNFFGQELVDKRTERESVYFRKNVLEAENSGCIKDNKIILETHLKFKKGQEIPWMISRIDAFYKEKDIL